MQVSPFVRKGLIFIFAAMFAVKYRYLFILLLAIYSYVNISFSEVRTYYALPGSAPGIIGIFILMTAFIWEGNRLLDLILKRRPPFSNPVYILVTHFVISVPFAALAAGLIAYVAARYGYAVPSPRIPVIVKLAITLGTRINLFLHVINTIFFFSDRLKAKEIETEALKRAHAQAQLQAIKNQLNPHFLFNNLNVLSSLVMQERPEANRFIEEFSLVYRHVINAQQRELVPLGEELEFIEHYLYLLKQRFPGSIQVTIEIPSLYLSRMIVPVALQMLIENAIKHNVLSSVQPLNVNIFINAAGQLEVSNNLQPKTAVEESTYIGLRNIDQRYDLIIHQHINIKRTDSFFSVSLPLIETLP